MTTQKKVRGLLGGSFDPVHDGHLAMAQAVNNKLHHACQMGMIDDYQVSFLPTAANPFKNKQTAVHHRLAMLELALATLTTMGKPITIDTTELDITPKHQPSYTIDTLTAIKQQYPNDILVLTLGFDSLQSLPTWKKGLDIIKLAKLWVFLRPNHQQHALPAFLCQHISPDIGVLFCPNTQAIYQDNTPIVQISSTAIRQAIARQDGTHLPLPTAVKAYIQKEQLYLKTI